MDRFAAEMIASGPTYSGEALTGSVHLLGPPDPVAARDVLLRRWENQLGRTRWRFGGRPS